MRGKVGGKESLLISEAATGGEDGPMSKGQLPTDNQRARALKGVFQGCIGGGRGLCAGTAQSALTVVLNLVTRWWSDQHHPDCFKHRVGSRVGLCPFL